MFKKILLILTVIIPVQLMAQISEGTVDYLESIKLQIDLPEGASSELLDKIPQEQNNKRVLHFKNGQCIYTLRDHSGDIDVSHGGEDEEFQFNMKVPTSIRYYDTNTGEYIHQLEFLGRDFLVIDEMDDLEWKITGEQKKLGDFLCLKAELQEDDRKVVAWYSPKIPISVGPEGLGGLPGLIIKVDIDNGARIIMATDINLDRVEVATIERPSKGKKMSRDKFEKMRTEKLNEMGATEGKGGVRMIIIEETDDQ